MKRPGRTRAAKRRMLIIVNPYATTVSDRLRNLVVYALQGRYEVEAVSTEAQNHATEIGREARDGGYDMVVAFGGDGTLNEVVNGLAGTDRPGLDAAGRLDQCRLPHPRHPQRCRRRYRAPALAGRRVVARAASTSARSTTAASSSPAGWGSTPRWSKRVDAHPQAEGEGWPLLLQLGRDLSLLPPLPAQPRADAG